MTTDLVHGDTSARVQRTQERMVGRESELQMIHGLLSDPDGPRLVYVRGEPGAGRTSFLRAAHGRLRAEGTSALFFACVPGDEERPLLLALRLITTLVKTQSDTARQQSGGRLVANMMSAAEKGERTAAAEALTTAVTQYGPTVMVVDDIEHGDADSLTILSELDFAGIDPGTRLVVSAGGPVRPQEPGLSGQRLAEGKAVRTIDLPRLQPHDIEAALAKRFQATPDDALVQRTHELTQGVPGVIDALLTAWTQQDAIRVVQGHAFLAAGVPVPALPDSAPFLATLHTLGEPGRTVAGALSVLWPLGPCAPQLLASSTGLSHATVSEGIRDLTQAGILEELPRQDGTATGGWAFRVPLMAYAVEARLGPWERSQLSAAAVTALWDTTEGSTGGRRAAIVLPQPQADFYLADRIADAVPLVDRDRAVEQLTAIAERQWPDLGGRGMLRWFRAAARLIEDPAARGPALLRNVRAAYVSGDFPAARTIAESLLRTPHDGLTMPVLHGIAGVLASAAAVEKDWPFLTRMAAAQWWDRSPLPAGAAVGGRAVALCQLGRWREAVDLLSRTESLWHTTPDSRTVPVLHRYRAAAELMLGQPELFTHSLTMPELGDLPPDLRYVLTVVPCEQLLCSSDLQGAQALLSDRGLAPEALPPYGLFLWHHLEGRWDEALKPARWLLATGQAFTSATDRYLLPARTAAILLARGGVNNAHRLINSARGGPDGPLEHSLDHAEADVLRTLGDPSGAAQSLRRGLSAADARAHVHGTDELWAALTDIHAEAGRTSEAVTCLRRLHKVVQQLDSGRSRLLYLLASARVLRQDAPDRARRDLREAVDLARSRSQPFETAVTLSAAADNGAGPATLLHEAYELFQETGAALWRFHTRTALREAGLTVPGRKGATAESQHLLATLIAEGLTNRQVATVLRLSEKAVADRISRLLARTGLRSRAEVVTTVLTQDR
ncbi:AAA family ATPase [Streptomyces mirabilis]|uniref:AAA family ATPase n=2 Tax=Streptomyces mirabilis TaxID=68239 RepID=UPI0022579175|nr:AAA family ATPase [Streptomyces mirabilis]MCX4428719.1 AAA family ATPase [Streptomyces mirabilis]